MTDTPLDRAHGAMQAAPDDDTARLRFFDRLADAELFLMLAEEARGDNLSPEVFELSDGPVVLAFDREDRLAAFAGAPVPYAALPGRVIVGLLAGQGIGLGLNLEVAPSSILLDGGAMDWLADMLAAEPARVETGIAEVAPPVGLPEALVSALDSKLVTAQGLAAAAHLVSVTYANGTAGHMLAFVDARPGAGDALARAVGEAVAFSGAEAGFLDVGMIAGDDPVAARLARVGLRFVLPEPETPAPRARPAPGSDPDKPPILG